MNQGLQAIVERWVEAERGNDSQVLADVIADDFRFVGPAGFVLERNQFLHRYDSGDLVNSRFDLSDIDVREHGDHAVAIGVWQQETSYQGKPNNGNFRVTMVFTKDDDAWKVLSGQLSPMMGPA